VGWARGTDLVRRIVRVVRDTVSDPATRRAIYAELIDAFQDADWDTEDEARGLDPVFDATLDDVQVSKH
jgi:hypothetical protein